ncbi:organic cation transporter protein isoform X2 [Octopus bimaculoides]|uniref:Major facilitator superfamily (MFS) profile domain-containing protein n=1 Tax=Octopus bimaculoides TaxID=37653 RepID=A0A0L8FVN4_OCTBM|nr:organic cation transporter protein isoform X2 [Octopus bimaculoides]|eukprot:XP_014786493.1 PREDICTED: organic cation transporter protein-like isoform X3 [Octopus bimaculoides]
MSRYGDNDSTKQDSSTSEITEEILQKCGGYGLFQKILTIFVLIFVIFHATSTLTMVFIREKVPFSCYPSNFNESMIPPNISLDEFLNDVTVKEEKCSVYNLDIENGFYILPNSNSTKEPCNNGQKFYTKDLSSIVSEFDLVCEKEWLKNFAVSVMFGGYLIGNLIFGISSDKFGRFKMLCAADILFICSCFARIHSPNYGVFIILYFLEGFGYAGCYINIYTILLECVSQNYRMHLNFAVHGAFALGETLLAGVAFLLRKWQHLLYAVTIPHILVLIVAVKYLPESPRWLLIQGKYAEAEKSFNRIARTNKKHNENVGKLIWKLQRETERKSKFEDEVEGNTNLENTTHTAIDLLKTPRRAMITTNIWFNWLVNSMLYYGVTLNSVDMSGNRYINFFMMSAVEIPSNILGCITFKWFGHRKPLCFFMVFGGINCIVSNFVPTGNFWFPLLLAVLGKFGTTLSFDGVYLTSAELFPTAVRNGGMGTASSFARFGGIISPLILGLSVYGSWIPLSVYGVFGIVAGLLILLLPEMKDVCLLQTLEDMDNL